MISHETHVRVRYGETDQMAYVYYGKYAEYFEVGRVELIRSIGLNYKEIEAQGILMPVAKLEVDYKYPAHYDDLLRIKTTIPEKPRSAFLTEYEIYNEEEKLLVTGKVKLAFFDKERMRPVRVPAFVKEAVEAHWRD
ncbi:MAG: thioesterase family protein [Bacteroidota bacterium]